MHTAIQLSSCKLDTTDFVSMIATSIPYICCIA